MAENSKLICIVCPVGCVLDVTQENDGIAVTGHTCKRGLEYGKQEFTNPMRMVTSLAAVVNGKMPVVPVRTSGTVPKNKIPLVLKEIKEIRASSEVREYDVLLVDVAGTGVNVIATADADFH